MNSVLMAVFLKGKDSILHRLKHLFPSQRCNHVLMKGGFEAEVLPEIASGPVGRESLVVDMSKWKKLNAYHFGIEPSMIPSSTFTILKILRKKGHEAYLVGGCVRDLLLNKIPKDFDIITTAKLEQVHKQFHRSVIIGKRFPICQVRIRNAVVEVSSFETSTKHAEEKDKVLLSHMPHDCDEKDFLLWRNSMHRDFTINSLFFDPYKNRIYDYVSAMADLKSLKLRTLIPAEVSFQEDCARILRGIRIAGRLGLSISRETKDAIYKLSSSLKCLDKWRVMLELNYMLSYGAAESTIYLLKRFNLLELFLPLQAAYLDQQACARSAQSSVMLMKLFFSLDKLVGCDRPCDRILWIALLAFHQALVMNPQDSLVVKTFASALYLGNWREGLKFARQNAKVEVNFEPELSGHSEFKSDQELSEGVAKLVSLVQASVDALVDHRTRTFVHQGDHCNDSDTNSLSNATAEDPSSDHDAESLSNDTSEDSLSPCSGFVFVPEKTGNRVAQLFDDLVNDNDDSHINGRKSYIDYFSLKKGDLWETRFVLGEVILEAVGCGLLKRGMEVDKEAEFIEVMRDATNSDSIKHGLVAEKCQKHLLPSIEPKQEMVKKPKLVCSSEHESAREKKQVVLEENRKEMVKKSKLVHSSEQESARKKEQAVLEGNRKEMVKRPKLVNSSEQESARKKKLVVLEDKHKEIVKEQLKVIGTSNKMQKSTIEIMKHDALQREISEILQDGVKLFQEKTEKSKEVSIKEKSSQPSLSSLFR